MVLTDLINTMLWYGADSLPVHPYIQYLTYCNTTINRDVMEIY